MAVLGFFLYTRRRRRRRGGRRRRARADGDADAEQAEGEADDGVEGAEGAEGAEGVEGVEAETETETEMGRFLAWFGMQIGGGRRHAETQRERDATTRAD